MMMLRNNAQSNMLSFTSFLVDEEYFHLILDNGGDE